MAKSLLNQTKLLLRNSGFDIQRGVESMEDHFSVSPESFWGITGDINAKSPVVDIKEYQIYELFELKKHVFIIAIQTAIDLFRLSIF